MRNNTPIQVFEYEFLPKDSNGFEHEHWLALAKYNEEYGGNYFKLTHDGVRFQNYVGVIQVGNLTIEILPKIGKEASIENKTEWQQVLIEMLRECNWMKIHANEKASLQYKYNSILEAYLELFINECESILRQGLLKKYRFEESNCNSLKGKLLFGKNIQKNLVHQEHFYTRNQKYDRNNIYNQLLLKALKLIPTISNSPFLKDRVYSLQFTFPELNDISVNEQTFNSLIFDRKNYHYQSAIEISAMLLLNYRPDISSGNNKILAILFDMNSLWEEYIYRQIEKWNIYDWNIAPQDQSDFWKQLHSNRKKVIKPDIVISDANKTIIIDTKWKLPEDDIPSDSDLKQMYVYNEYWEGMTSILLYPHAIFKDIPIFIKGKFNNTPNLSNYTKRVNGIEKELEMHTCGIMKISVTKNKLLDENIGERINKYLKENIFHEQ